MSTFIRVFCRDPGLVAAGEVAQLVRDGQFFADPPVVEPADPLLAPTDEWDLLTIWFDPNLRPISLWRTTAGPLLSEDVAEARQALAGAGGSDGVVEHLMATRVIYALEITDDELPDAAWEMLDVLEADLARRFDGVVYATGDGFFDADLDRIVSLDN